jgi:hypothetical protein
MYRDYGVERALVRTDVSEELSASFIWTFTNPRHYLLPPLFSASSI